MRDYCTDQFEKDAEALGVSLTAEQTEQFLIFYEMLAEQNRVMNLTAITEYDEVLKKHFVDSLSLAKVRDLSRPLSVIDVGTGAGFPGIPLKIAFPKLRITLLDSLNKRVSFLNRVIGELRLQEIEAIHGRAEDFGRGILREKYDLSVSRAVANLSTLSEYCLPFVRVGGQFISYKSEKLAEERQSAENAIRFLGGKIAGQEEFTLPDSDLKRILLVIDKTEKTPKKYPRKAGLPGKEPL